jgi:hypothetical protein
MQAQDTSETAAAARPCTEVVKGEGVDVEGAYLVHVTRAKVKYIVTASTECTVMYYIYVFF